MLEKVGTGQAQKQQPNVHTRTEKVNLRMKQAKTLFIMVLCTQALWLSNALAAPDIDALESLGKYVFFDKISDPARQSCASCHSPRTGWTTPRARINLGQVVMPGANPHTAGRRKPPTIAYTSTAPFFGESIFSPFLGGCESEIFGFWCWGGLFWDGRATGTLIGEEVFAGNFELEEAYGQFLGPLADQALAPFSNDVEQNVPDGNDNGLPGAEFVCRHVKAARYSELYELSWGEPIDCSVTQVDISFKRIAVAISAWEQSAEVNSYSSKRDIALRNDDDDTPGEFPLKDFSDQENLGHDLFFGLTSTLNPTGKDARCAVCHNSEARDSIGNELEQQFTDNAFNHIGVPPNYEIANFDPFTPDVGLSEHTSLDPISSGHAGHFRTPTLRNVDKRKRRGFPKAYMHNGYFKNLEDIVHFYNTSQTKLDPVNCPPGTTAAQARARDCWPAAEVDSSNQAHTLGLMGDLGLTEAEEAALVAYMKTLTDTIQVRPPKPYKKRRSR